MEEFRHRLNQSTPVVANACDILYNTIGEKLDNGEEEKKIGELDLLWTELKTSKNSLTANSCAKVIAKLTFDGKLNSKDVLTSFLTCAPHVSCPEGVVFSIGELLWGMEPAPDYGIAKNQHPFISLLRASPDKMWPFIASSLQNHLNENSLKAVALHRSVMIFVFCDPHTKSSLSPLRSILMNDLLAARNSDGISEFLHEIIVWLPLEKCSNHAFEESLSLLVLPWLKFQSVNTFPYLCSLALQSTRRGLSPKKIFKMMEKAENGTLDNISMILLALIFEHCSFDYIEQVLAFSLEKNLSEIDSRAYGVFIISLLPVMVQHNSLAPNSAKLSAEIIHRFYKAIRTGDSTSKDAKMWINEVPPIFQFDPTIREAASFEKKGFQAICSQLIISEDKSQILTALDDLQILLNEDRAKIPSALTVILHKLSRAKDCRVTWKLMKTLPTLAKDKTCVASILAFVNRFDTHKGLGYLRLELLYKLWKSEPRCYVYLQRAIEQECTFPNEKIKYKYLLTKVHIIGKICATHAEQHGADLLKPLNDMMNENDNVTVTKAAINGIASLCQVGVIDITTTVKVLSPKFKLDPRVPVSKAFYSLLAVGPSFNLESEDYKLFLQSTLTMMWKYAYDKNLGLQIRQNILVAISSFQLDLHQVQMLPEFVHDTSEDQPQPPSDTDGIPGHYWVQMLEHSKNEGVDEAFETLVTKLAEQEVKNLPRGVYHLSQAMKNKLEENANYNFLPETSLVRAIVSKIISCSSPGKSYLRILSNIENRPLPPLDWKQMKAALKSNARKDFLALVAKQCSVSYSARSLLEDFLREWSSAEVALDIMPFIQNFFPHLNLDIMRPHLTVSLILWYESVRKDKSCFNIFKAIFQSYVNIIKDTEIEKEKDDIIEAIVTLHRELVDEKEFFYNAILDLPEPTLEQVISDVDVVSALNVRRNMAVKKDDVNLQALNDIIDTLAKDESDGKYDCDMVREAVGAIFQVTPSNHLKNWTLEIMGQILFLLRQNCSAYTLQFMLEIFTIGTAYLGGHRGKSGQGFQELPKLLSEALKTHPEIGPPCAEWMTELYCKHSLLNKIHRQVLRQCFQIIKQCDGYFESTVWGKLTMVK